MKPKDLRDSANVKHISCEAHTLFSIFTLQTVHNNAVLNPNGTSLHQGADMFNVGHGKIYS